MSHVAAIEVEITSMEALKRACQSLGLELRVDQKTFQWYGRWMNDYDKADAAYKLGIKPEDYGKCEHAIADPNSDHPYEVGLMKNPNGNGLLAVADFFGMGDPGHICNKVGRQCEKLLQQYQVEVAQLNGDHLIEDGLTEVSRRTLEDGSVQLVFEEP